MFIFYYSYICICAIFSILPWVFGKRNLDSFLFSASALSSGLWIFSILNVFQYQSLLWVNGAYVFSGIFVLINVLFTWLYPVRQFNFTPFLKSICIIFVAFYMYFGLVHSFFATHISKDLDVIYGMGRDVFLVVLLLGMILFLMGVFRGMKLSSPINKMQLKYYVFGTACTFFIGLIIVFVVPIFVGSSQYSIYAPLFYPITMALHFYAIIKHQLLDIRIIIKRSVVYLCVMGVLSIIFFASFISITQLLSLSPLEELICLFLISFLILSIYPSFVMYINTVTDRFFFRQSYSFQEVSSTYDKNLILLQKSGDIINYFMIIILETIRPKEWILYYKNELGEIFTQTKLGQNPYSGQTLPFSTFFDGEANVNGELKDCKHDPLDDQYELVGGISTTRGLQVVLCLASKSVELPYEKTDRQLINLLLNRTAIALDHVCHYEDIIRYSQILSRFNSLFVTSKPISNTLDLMKSCTPVLYKDFFGEFIVSFQSLEDISILFQVPELEFPHEFSFVNEVRSYFYGLMSREESILLDELSYDKLSDGLREFFKLNDFKSIVFLSFQSENEDIHYLAWFTRVRLDGSMVFTQLLSSFHHSLHSFYKRVHLYNQIIKANTYNQDVLHTMLVGIVIFDQHGTIKHLNSEGSRVLNTSMTAIGHAVDSLDLESSLQSFLDYVCNVTQVNSFEIKLDNGLILTASSTRVSYKHTYDTVCLLTDITGFRKLERQLEQSDRLASLSNLSRGLSREIGRPISSLQMNMNQLSDVWGDESQMFELSETISNHVDHINSLCQSLLRLGKPSPVQFMPVNLNTLFKEAQGLVKGDLSLHNVSINDDFEQAIIVKGDYNQLLQVVLNCLINAIESFNGKGGGVFCSFNIVDASCVVAIRDYGIGIELVKQSQIFDPFFTTKPKRNGLGLTIAKRIIEDHLGELLVTSLDDGVEVLIKMPLYTKGAS